LDYRQITRNYDLARLVDYGMIDEVFVNSAPYFGGWESNMHGFGGYWCNSSPQPRIPCSHIYVVMDFNYERYIGEMLEDYGHRSESILRVVYGSWSATLTHMWNRFTIYDKELPGEAGCGNVHFAPNSQSDYDWGNLTYVWSYCDDFLNNYPYLLGTKKWVNKAEWGGGDIRAHHVWWFTRFPHLSGKFADYGGLQRLNNWWEYTQNFNVHTESNGDHAPGGAAPTTSIYNGPVSRITDNLSDDFRPQINASGRAVWARLEGTNRWRIWSGNADGSGAVALGDQMKAAELPQLNSSGKVVWQAFDGNDYEIFTADSDGSNLVQVTNNGVNDWHPAISDSGKIVWEHFNGVDYDIYSANADGTGIVQITNNTVAFPAWPRDDMWPRINASNRVVWMGYDGTNWDIFSANADGTNLVNVSNNSNDNEYPQISDGGKVVWHCWVSDSNAEVYIANATGGTVTRVTTNSVMDWWPQINAAGDMVWMQRSSSNSKWQIMRRTAAGTVSAITNFTQHSQYPVIDNNGRIAWQGFDGTHWQIYYYESGAIYRVTDSSYDNRAPALAAGAAIVWHGQSVGGSSGATTEIYSTTLHANTAPHVDAGADQSIPWSDVATLDAAVSDDGLPDPPAAMTYTWSKVSGPGTVAFGNAQAPNTTATFSASGTYVLQVAAYDGQYTAADTVTIAALARGDLNCDGLVNNGDIDPFVLDLTQRGAYRLAYPNCNEMLGDINADGLVNNGDIDAFVALLTGG
jgi:Tol biopolymer transport system component